MELNVFLKLKIVEISGATAVVVAFFFFFLREDKTKIGSMNKY